MTPKYWLITGFGCLTGSVLTALAFALTWFNRVQSFAAGDSGAIESFTAADPIQSFGPIMLGAAVGNLLFFGGIIMVIIGSIALAKEPTQSHNPT